MELHHRISFAFFTNAEYNTFKEIYLDICSELLFTPLWEATVKDNFICSICHVLNRLYFKR